MASGKLLRQLIKSGTKGDTAAFRAASEAVINEEREKNHHLLANDLERLLYGDQAAVGNDARKLHPLFSLPTNKDNGLALLEERAVIREEKDIILSDATQSALDEILMEHNRADVLRSSSKRRSRKPCAACVRDTAAGPSKLWQPEQGLRWPSCARDWLHAGSTTA